MTIHAAHKTGNQIRGTIREIRIGDRVSEIDLDTAVGRVTSVVATGSLDRARLAVGQEAIALVGPTGAAPPAP